MLSYRGRDVERERERESSRERDREREGGGREGREGGREGGGKEVWQSDRYGRHLVQRRVRKEWREKSASMWPTIVADNQHDILYFDGCSVLYSVQKKKKKKKKKKYS